MRPIGEGRSKTQETFNDLAAHGFVLLGWFARGGDMGDMRHMDLRDRQCPSKRANRYAPRGIDVRG